MTPIGLSPGDATDQLRAKDKIIAELKADLQEAVDRACKDFDRAEKAEAELAMKEHLIRERDSLDRDAKYWYKAYNDEVFAFNETLARAEKAEAEVERLKTLPVVELFEDASQWGYGKEPAILIGNDKRGSFFAEHNGVRAIILWLREQGVNPSGDTDTSGEASPTRVASPPPYPWNLRRKNHKERSP